MTAALFQRYQDALNALPAEGRVMPYGWTVFPETISAQWMAYGWMLEEFPRGLANTINDLTRLERSLRAWASVIEPLTDEEKLDATSQFIDAPATTAVNLPYVIRARFAFAVTHLSHQANQLKDPAWRDELPDDDRIHLNEASKFGGKWSSYPKLHQKLERISGKDYTTATQNFRNIYTHRLEPRFVIGISNTVTRKVADGSIQYAFGGNPPLDLKHVASALAIQRDRCYLAYEAFQVLVQEQCDLITAFIAEE
jgi:hypothetical protein